MNAPGKLVRKPVSVGAATSTYSGVHSTAQARQVFLLMCAFTQRSQKDRRHLGQNQRAGLFGWNLQTEAAACVSTGGASGGGIMVAPGAAG